MDFTPAAERALLAAASWCADGEHSIGGTALLLGLLDEPQCQAATTLARHNVDAAAVLRRWPQACQRAASYRAASPPSLTRSLAAALEHVRDRLWELPRPLGIATEHLLLALVVEGGEVGEWLAQRGLSSDGLQREIYALHGVTPGPLEVDEDLSPAASNTEGPRPAPATLPPSDATGPPQSDFEPPRPAPQPPEQTSSTARILDAAANRAGEGLRVIEDFVRFALDDGHLTRLCKQMRHELAAAVRQLPIRERLAARETMGDVGTGIVTPDEYARADVSAVIHANFQRLQQSLRSLEEFSKIACPELATRFERLRYRSYTLHRAIDNTHASGERLSDAQLYVLIGGCGSLDEFRDLVAALVEAGVNLLQLRDKQLSDRQLLAHAKVLRETTRQSKTLFIMNDRPDLALLAGADGVHVGQEELPAAQVRKLVGSSLLVGVSTHNIEQARQAVLDGANYIGVGPTFPSRTKQFDQFAGLDFVRQVAAEIRLPAFAIGGITRDNVDQVIDAGLRRIAASGAVVNAREPVTEVRELLNRLKSPAVVK